jgi:putative glutathione S-transferase
MGFTSLYLVLFSNIFLVFSLRLTQMSSSIPPAARTALAEMNPKGAFIRTDSAFRDIISSDHPIFKPESGRYHLYISLACPWANRCNTLINMKGLENCIGVSVVHPVWQRTRPENDTDLHCGWKFESSALCSPSGKGSFLLPGLGVDEVNGARFIRDLYEKAGDKTGKYSVPVLWDKETGTIVNNESSEILRMLNQEFNVWANGVLKKHDFYPLALRPAIDEVNEWVYRNINNGTHLLSASPFLTNDCFVTDYHSGVYRCGFAQSQEAYDEAVTQLYTALDRAEGILATSRYIAGSQLTEADVRLFMTLVRFDEVYVIYFKCNVRRVWDYSNIRDYCREMYQLPGVASAINMDHIKIHYFA